MKFDSARAIGTVAELNHPRFTAEGGEQEIAGYVADRVTSIGWRAEQRQVTGSKFAWLAASWIGWLGAVVLATAATLVIRTSWPRWPLPAWCSPALIVWSVWYVIGLAGGLRLGCKLPPRGAAPLIVAHRQAQAVPACRVVLATPIGPISALPPGSSQRDPAVVGAILSLLFLWSMLIAPSNAAINPPATSLARDLAQPAIILLGLFWLFVGAQTVRELRLSRLQETLEPLDRTGIALLLEIARTWSPPRDAHCDLVVAVTGGQTLDFAGARSLFRELGPEPERVPTLFLFLFAPSAGEITIVSRNCGDLAQAAARSLWIPHRIGSSSLERFGFWPREASAPERVALVGTGSLRRQPKRAPLDPATLGAYAQLANEIALRWVKRRS
jgi:hypothetical protein